MNLAETRAADQPARLRAHTTRLGVPLIVFGLFYLGVALLLHSVRFGGLAATLLTFQGAVWFARARIERGEVELPAQIVAYGTFYVCIGATAFMPVAYATLIVGCAMGVASVLPYLRGTRLAAVFVVGVVAAGVVAMLGYTGAPIAMPGVVLFATCVCAPTWCTYLLFSLLWQFSTRLQTTLDAERAAQGRLALLASASDELGVSLDYGTILATAARAAVPALADWCVADAIGVDGTMTRAHAGRSRDPNDPVSSRRGGAGAGVISGRTLVVPLAARGKAFGSMLFGRQPGRPRFDGAEEALVREYTRRAAWALENGRLYTEAQAANRVRDEFLATVSHELRTPLQAILGWSGVLRRRGGDASVAQRGFDIIERSVHAQQRLIDDLLDVGRILGGKLVIERRPTDCDAVVRAALDAVRPMAAAREVELVLSSEPGEGALFADPDRLQQIVWNLLTNAVKFSAKGGRVEVAVRWTSERVNIAVRDYGEGIEASFLPHVFDRFRQADSSATRRHGGLGLGLAIAHQLVELHGGVVRAESDGPGKGATFQVELPASSSDGPVERPAVTASGAPLRLDGLDVLVVEDEPDSRELLIAVLEEAGAGVRSATCSREALEQVRATVPDVIVSDIAMPEEDGYEMLAKARSMTARHHAWMPAIALTAYASSSDRARALQRGFQVHLGKPIRPEAIVDAVAALCSQCRARPSDAGEESRAGGE